MVCCTASGYIISGLGALGFCGGRVWGPAGGCAAGAGALCIAFVFVHFGVSFISEDVSSAISFLLVILPGNTPVYYQF